MQLNYKYSKHICLLVPRPVREEIDIDIDIFVYITQYRTQVCDKQVRNLV